MLAAFFGLEVLSVATPLLVNMIGCCSNTFFFGLVNQCFVWEVLAKLRICSMMFSDITVIDDTPHLTQMPHV